MADQSEEFSSWLESRRLIISQLSRMDNSVRELGVKVDRFNDTARERTEEMSREAQRAINDLNVRLSVLDMRVKMWAAGIGFGSAGLVELMSKLIPWK